MTEKTVFIKSYGCQMNVYDAQRMREILRPLGFRPVEDAGGADLVILNTCHIREKASEKVFSELGRLRQAKDVEAAEGRTKMIAVAGCVAQAEGAEIGRRAPFVDLVFGPQTYHRLPEMIAKAARADGLVLDTDFPVEDKFDHLPLPEADGQVSAFLTVQEGCDKFCTFCVVPYTRGAEFSRPVAQIEAEARALAAGGVRELTLLGQNVNAYHGAGPDGEAWGLGRLVRHLAKVDGIERLRYTTSHPRDMDDELIAAHGEVAELMPFLHLPIQSGSDRILAAMNRQHTADDYLRLIAKIRAARPDIALSCDFITGFPGETDADFEATLDLVREVEFAMTFSFKYSPRPGTPGASMDAQVPEAVKSDRLSRLQALLTEQQLAFNSAQIGKTLPVLLEKPGRHDGQLIGRSPYLQPVHLKAGSETRIGDIVPVRITGLGTFSLAGTLAGSSQVAAE